MARNTPIKMKVCLFAQVLKLRLMSWAMLWNLSLKFIIRQVCQEKYAK